MFSGAFGGAGDRCAIRATAASSPAQPISRSGGAIGLMGERGAEAIMPLARGPDGRLGVVAQGADARPVSVTVNIAAQDVESFRRSEGADHGRAGAGGRARPAQSLSGRRPA